MKETGKITKEADGYKVVFERHFDHNIQAVWEAITDPEKLKYWFTDMEINLRPGGKITFHFRDEEKTISYGEVVSVDPPNKFAFTWEGELGVYELFEEGENKCRLVFTYSKLNEQFAANAPAGWHTLLDRLDQTLDGERVIYPFGTEENDPEFLPVKQSYREMVLRDFPKLIRYEPIIIERILNAPIQRVWEAITDRDKMSQWYFDLEEFKPEIGFEFQFRGQGHEGEQYLHLCKVTEVVKFRRLAYSWEYEGYEGKSFVSFELEDLNGQTKVILTHKGLHTFPDRPDFARESFNGGWTELIGKLLKDFVER